MAQEAFGKSTERDFNTSYDDTDLCVVQSRDLNATGDQALSVLEQYDGLGRVTLSQQSESGTLSCPGPSSGSVINVATYYYYGGQGLYQAVSNPYRPTPDASMGWTLTKRDPGGRVVSVGTFGGSALPGPFGSNSNSTGVVTTTYNGPVTTVTDQSGATRVNTADGLGRLAQVTEDPNGLNYSTSYTYDAQGNLTHVFQGGQNGQTRTFEYDTLGRLKLAINPESGMLNYGYL